MLLPFLTSLLISVSPVSETAGTVADTLSEAVLVSSYKQVLPLDRISSPVTVADAVSLESRGTDAVRKLSSVIPNLHIPDYGSSMTSSIYLRGFGSRMENPVVSMYVDDIPVMNKNSYDTELFDIGSAVFLRGPQATLYGRNSMCGVLSLNTLSPETFRGTRLSLEYGSAGTVSARASVYGSSGIGFSAAYRHTDGYYLNTYDGKYADRSDGLGLRFRVWKKLRKDLVFENILAASMTDQGGYPYRQYDAGTGTLLPLAYNDDCGYRRLNVTEGLKFKYMKKNWTLNSVTSLQLLADEMILDQDFTVKSMFTLKQQQKEGTLTQELILRPEAGWRKPWWNWQTGFFGFAKYNAMSAPVRFKKDGINELILANANAGIQSGLENAELTIQEDEFGISSDFGMTTAGTALYHESYFSLGRWLLTAGLRVDYEFASMDYDSRALIHYRFEAEGLVPDYDGYLPYECVFAGREHNGYLEIMPKISAIYDAGPVSLFAVFSEGYRSGGFNTQIFSDILQNRMMNGLMEELGVAFDSPVENVGAGNTVYRPEKSLDFEIGARFDTVWGGHRLAGTVSVYNIYCVDQQITVFPEGLSTGRMMANAGNSRSCGIEAELLYRYGALSVSASYGYCDARFLDYDTGTARYDGNRIPYSPEHTLFARGEYTFGLSGDYFRGIAAGLEVSSQGRIWWDEANTMYEPFHACLGADVRGLFRWFDIYLRGENLSGATYNTFYFKSVGNAFFQTCKPLRLTVGLAFKW